MLNNQLIEKLRVVAYDPELATDEGHDIVDGQGLPVLYIAHPCATEEEILAAEATLGFELPALLKAIYTEVGNGGFGPGYGMWGVPGVNCGSTRSIVSEYADRRTSAPEYPDWHWPAGLLPICDWGCGITSCVDCQKPEAMVVRYLPDLDLPDHIGLEPENKTFENWIIAWLKDDDLFNL